MQRLRSLVASTAGVRLDPFRIVSFETAQTLFRCKEKREDVIARFAKGYGMEIDAEAFFVRSSVIHNRLRYTYPCFARDTHGSEWWWQELVRMGFFQITRDPEFFDKFCKEVFDYYATKEPYELMEENVTESLKAIKDKGYKTGIIADADYRLRNVLKELDLLPYFDVILLSGEQGIRKDNHDPKVYYRFVDMCNEQIPDGEAYAMKDLLNIGADMNMDYRSAKYAGAQSMAYNSDKFISTIRQQFNSKVPAFRQITSLSAFVEDYVKDH